MRKWVFPKKKGNRKVVKKQKSRRRMRKHSRGVHVARKRRGM